MSNILLITLFERREQFSFQLSTAWSSLLYYIADYLLHTTVYSN